MKSKKQRQKKGNATKTKSKISQPNTPAHDPPVKTVAPSQLNASTTVTPVLPACTPNAKTNNSALTSPHPVAGRDCNSLAAAFNVFTASLGTQSNAMPSHTVASVGYQSASVPSILFTHSFGNNAGSYLRPNNIRAPSTEPNNDKPKWRTPEAKKAVAEAMLEMAS